MVRTRSRAGLADLTLESSSTVDSARPGSSGDSTPALEHFRTFGALRPSDMEAELEALPLGEMDWQ